MFTKNTKGKITTIVGPMYSGKTLELLRLVDQLEYSKKEFIIFKPSIDTTEENIIKSRWNVERKAINVKSSKELINHIESLDKLPYAIIIDEIQFFDEAIISLLDKMAFDGMVIVTGGLDRDFLGRPFPVVSGMLSISEDIVKLHSICKICGEEAHMSQKLINGNPVLSGEEVVELKDKATYIPVCRKHFKIK